MRRFVICLLVAASFSAIAGDHGKCTASTQECAVSFQKWAKTGTWSGVWAKGLFEEGKKVVVDDVAADSPGAKAGIQVGDVLVSMDGMKLANISKENYKKHKKGLTPGSVVTYGLYRDGVAKSVKVSMIAVPTDVVAKKLGHHILNSHGEHDTEVASN